MPQAKQVIVQAKVNGELVFDQTISGKKHRNTLIRACMSAIDHLGGNAVIRTQEVGAKGWAHYSCAAGDKVAVSMPPLDF